jgi:hypothetical protein
MTLDAPGEFQFQQDQGDHGGGQMALPDDFVNRERDGAELLDDRGTGLFQL